jgi:hypothetical protein
MKAIVILAVVALVLAMTSSAAQAEFTFKARQLDKKFETYNVKKISLALTGTWSAGAKVDPAKMAEFITEILERKGYQVVIKKEKGEKDESVDAILKVGYRSMTAGSIAYTEIGTGKGGTAVDYYVQGSAQLTLAKPPKKTLYSASGTTASQYKSMGGNTFTMLDPAREFCRILEPIPAAPEAEEKKGKEEGQEKEKKEEGGKKDKGKKEEEK